jgi:hypothetical protein
MRWKRGKRLNDWSMSYYSDCGQYRVDRVSTMGRTKQWRAMVRTIDERWDFLTRKYFKSRDAAEEACKRNSTAPEQLELVLA